jgi:lysyl-tRNA synthetase class 1
VLRVNPNRHIDYDAGLGILDMVDEYDRVENMHYCGGCEERDRDLLRAYELSQPEGPRSKLPLQIPYRHLVSLVQITDSFDGVLAVLRRMGALDDSVSPEDMGILKQRVDCVKYWLTGFAPDEVKFAVCEDMPPCELNDQEKAFLRELFVVMEGVEWKGERIHDAMYECAKKGPIGAKGGFQALYKIFCNQRQGPRLGFFLSTLDRDFVLGRIKEASC